MVSPYGFFFALMPEWLRVHLSTSDWLKLMRAAIVIIVNVVVSSFWKRVFPPFLLGIASEEGDEREKKGTQAKIKGEEK
jgi:hypothetical protein